MFPVRSVTIAAMTGLLPASPALADISATDVWANSAALFEALGGSQQGELVRDGDRITVRGHSGVFDLPMGTGSISFVLSDYEMTEADGTVIITYPDGMEIALAASITGESDVAATMQLVGTAIDTFATGDPGAISYFTETGPVSLILTDLDLPGEVFATATLEVGIAGYVTETRIIEDTLLVIYSRSELGRSTSRSEFDDGFGYVTTTFAESAPSTSTINMGLIPGGADILNMSAALRDGMYISGESYAESSTSETLSYFGEEVTQHDLYEVGEVSASFVLDRTQLAFGVDVGPGLFEMLTETFMYPAFGIDWQGATLDIAAPILRSAAPQPFRFGVGLDDLRLGPTIWAMFDPDKALPRGPGSAELRMTGEMILDADLPDFLALPELGGRQEVAAQVTEVEIEAFGLSALGVTADSSGSFALDYEGYSPAPGVPWPEGEGRAEIRGLNGLIDMLIDQGLIRNEEALPLRIAISMGTIVTGDDVLSSEVEFTEGGRIIANGQTINLP